MVNDKARRSVIQFEDVSFEYPGAETESIHHISLDIKKGEFLVLTGGSGCGKTTLTRLINGLAEQFYEGTLKGRVTLLGRSISEYPLYEIGKKVGSIFQDPKSQFFASITEDEIAFGCENYGVPYEELDGRVSSAIKRINGDMLRGKEIYPMSSGEKQKIAVASVNAVDPEIYVFDEPSANLDMYSVEALKNLMSALKAEGHTIIVAEHRLYYLTDLADRFLYMENGSIKEEWTAQELLSIPEGKREKIYKDRGHKRTMKKRIVFATGNENKMKEIRMIMADLGMDIVSMKEAGVDLDIVEDGMTFEENAEIKARAVSRVLTSDIVLADDSGLEIDYLDKAPGIYSARFAGEDTSYDIKNRILLDRMEGVPEEQRTARFVCAVAAVFPDGTVSTVRGTVEGKVAEESEGENGFGYDPIFYVPEYGCTTAQMTPEQKNEISHRGKALHEMREVLKKRFREEAL